MRAPGFWLHDGAMATLLSPLGALYAAATARRMARAGWRAPVAVICCGNASAGGTGKTTLALDLGARLLAQGVPLAFLTRGYGGRASAPLLVEPDRHTADQVGDEPLLLAALAPTWVARDRAAAARAAIAQGAQALVMDDGLQNPSLAKTCALLVIDGAVGFGNGRCIPAGPLREPAAAAARCRAAVLIGDDATGALRRLPSALAVLRADLRPAPEIAAHVGRKVVAFAGIGRPDKFFDMLVGAGVEVVRNAAFADHHRYAAAELAGLRAAAAQQGATLLTTPKDAARLSAADRRTVAVVGVRLAWQDAAAVDRLLAEALR